MPIAAGTMNQRVQFLRRSAGVYAPVGEVQWGRLRYERPSTINIVGVPFQGREGQLTVRACDLTRGLGVGDRCELDGSVFEVTIRKAVEIDSDDIHLEIESAPTPALYAEEMDRRGSRATLQRGSGSTALSVQCRAIVTGFKPDELVGDIDQGARQIWLLAADVAASDFPAPPLKNDKIKVRGNILNVMSVDADSHRSAEVLNAYYIVAKGDQGL